METSWSIVNQVTGSIVAGIQEGDLTQLGFTYTESVCLPTSDNCFMFTISDSWGDGIINGGYYDLSVGGQNFQGSEFGSSQSHEFGTCICGNGEKLWQLDFTTDNFGEEFKWFLKQKNSSGKFKTVVEKAKFGTYESNTSYSEKFCVSDNECYKNVFVDKFGDGMCCSNGSGTYKVTYAG